MPRTCWSLWRGRPIIEVNLMPAQGGQPLIRRLIADTGAGTSQSRFDLLLDEHDCVLCGATSLKAVALGGAYVGSYPTYAVTVAIPVLGFQSVVSAVGVTSPPAGFDGIACFRFLDRFSYGNFGITCQFGLALYTSRGPQ